MSKPNHNRSRNRNIAPVDESNPTIMAFKQYALELDDKHDRYERIVKLSRDITIESKRIIFLLHTIDPNKNNKEKILLEAKGRLDKLIKQKFYDIAVELENRDPYQYLRAFCFGLQEFIEAYTFYECINNSDLSDWKVLQERMIFDVRTESDGDENKSPDEKDEKKRNLVCLVDPTEYILGLGDLTGELMRRCINSLGSGDTNTCQETCTILRDFYKGFLCLHGVRNREFGKKLYTLNQSVLKAENVCYDIKVRGCEAACRGTMSYDKPADDIDEGFF